MGRCADKQTFEERGAPLWGTARCDGYVHWVAGIPEEKALIGREAGLTGIRAAPGGRWRAVIPEHHLVMEMHLGRGLRPFEGVHHRSGNKADNGLANLELLISHLPGAMHREISWLKDRMRDCPHCREFLQTV